MDLNDLHPADDFSHRFFIWHEWIQANGPLTPANALEYFATSMFYDKQSNNQVLRMQTMHTGVALAPADEAEELRRFTGIEFALVDARGVPPTLFIVHKRERISRDEVRPLAVYFIINNRIYQAPDVYTVLSNRLLTSLHSIQTSLDILRAHKPDYTPRTGFLWPIRSTGGADEQGTHTPKPDAPTLSRRQENSMLLLNAMRTTAAHTHAHSRAGQEEAGTHARSAGPLAPPPLSAGMKAPTDAPPSPPAQEDAQATSRAPFPSQKKKRKRTLTAASAS